MSTTLLPGKIVGDSSWYRSEEGRRFLARTDNGLWMFVWEAVYTDSTVVRQFGDLEFHRALTDAAYTPPADGRISVDSLDKSKVTIFTLHPTAITREYFFNVRPVVTLCRPDKGEQLLSYWLTDYIPATGYRLRRTVVGIQKGGQRILAVISPSGQITICTDDNQSYEGE